MPTLCGRASLDPLGNGTPQLACTPRSRITQSHPTLPTYPLTLHGHQKLCPLTVCAPGGSGGPPLVQPLWIDSDLSLWDQGPQFSLPEGEGVFRLPHPVFWGTSEPALLCCGALPVCVGAQCGWR